MRSPHFTRAGPDSLLLHLLQAGHKIAAAGGMTEQQLLMSKMLAGIQKYQTWQIPPMVREHPIFWRDGQVRLLHLTPQQKVGAPSVVLVPSLINSWHIFDLLPGQSFSTYLSQAGYNIFVIDWGDLTTEPNAQTFEDLLRNFLAVGVTKLTDHLGEAITLIGYCMGGLLAAGVYPYLQHCVDRLVYMATPWDFTMGNPRLTQLVRASAPQILPQLAISNRMPNTQIQALLATIDPDMAINKYAQFTDMARGDPRAEIFVAVEDWLRTGHDLPAEIARACLSDWYLNNCTAGGTWRVGDTVITPHILSAVKSLVVAPKNDKLVEVQTAVALASQLGSSATLHTPDCGHIGMMASPRAQDLVWAPLVNWMHTTA